MYVFTYLLVYIYLYMHTYTHYTYIYVNIYLQNIYLLRIWWFGFIYVYIFIYILFICGEYILAHFFAVHTHGICGTHNKNGKFRQATFVRSIFLLGIGPSVSSKTNEISIGRPRRLSWHPKAPQSGPRASQKDPRGP